MDESPPQADHGHLSTPGDDEHHYTPPTSRSPSVTVESAPFAEYREWPFQGFLKRITIGNQTTYNLEFALPRIPEHLELSIHSGVSGAGSREFGRGCSLSHGRHVSQAGQGADEGARESVDQDGPQRRVLERDRAALPRSHTTVIQREPLHKARGEAAEAGSEA
jgi:hypothetical protein